jgi:hypothetical protein
MDHHGYRSSSVRAEDGELLMPTLRHVESISVRAGDGDDGQTGSFDEEYRVRFHVESRECIPGDRSRQW